MKKIYVGNLSYQMTEDDISEEFKGCGSIEEVKLIKNHETGQSKGFAFVSFADESSVETALEKNGQEVQGRKLFVNKAIEKQR